MAGQEAILKKIEILYKEKRAEGKSKKQAMKEARGAAYGMARAGRLGPHGEYIPASKGKHYGSSLADAVKEALADV